MSNPFTQWFVNGEWVSQLPQGADSTLYESRTAEIELTPGWHEPPPKPNPHDGRLWRLNETGCYRPILTTDN